MFQKTKLKLTGWYALLSLLITLLFSIAIYTNINNEFVRLEDMQQMIRERIELGIPTRIPHDRSLVTLNPDAIPTARMRLVLTLASINLAILAVSSAVGYFLAGQTLRPIQTMVDKQNRFITDASHELRTPLTSLRSEIEVNLRNKKMTMTEARSLLASNLEETINLQILSDSLLALSQLEKPNNSKSMSEVSLSECLEQALRKLNGTIKKKEITIEKDFDDVNTVGNSDSLIELFVILLDNAVKYSPKKSTIILSARNVKDFVEVKVKDQGVGILPEDLPHIFERFYRAAKSRSKEKVAGYGLGLSIAKKIVEQHGGTIHVESDIDRGTEFLIYFPLK